MIMPRVTGKESIPLLETELFSGLFSFGGRKTPAPHSQLWSWLAQITLSHSRFSPLNTGALQRGNGATSTNLEPSQLFIILNEYWHKDWKGFFKDEGLQEKYQVDWKLSLLNYQFNYNMTVGFFPTKIVEMRERYSLPYWEILGL